MPRKKQPRNKDGSQILGGELSISHSAAKHFHLEIPQRWNRPYIKQRLEINKVIESNEIFEREMI